MEIKELEPRLEDTQEEYEKAQKFKNVSEDQKTTKTMWYTSVQIHT